MDEGETSTTPVQESVPVPETVQIGHDCDNTQTQSGQPGVQVPRRSGRSRKPVDRLDL